MRILTVVGARPQFIKACMMSKTLNSNENIEETIVHTGQHYDDNMSTIFFKQLNLPKPEYYLGVGSGTHGKQTGKMLMELEKVMLSIKPDMVLVYGDTNSTLAGSLVASKLHIPIAHIESGLRSFNKKMPEEVNRIVTDHLSHWLFCPSNEAVNNLKKEGINKGVHQTGDIMYEAVLHFKPIALQQSTILKGLSLSKDKYFLSTIHRAENTDDPSRLKSILLTLNQLEMEVVLPLHPRTKSKIDEFNLTDLISVPNIKIVDPLNYFDMLTVSSNAKAILTDSGGLQKEAYMLQVPCITLRDETEWSETVESGWNHLTGADNERILDTLSSLQSPNKYPSIFGDGKTSEKISAVFEKDI